LKTSSSGTFKTNGAENVSESFLVLWMLGKYLSLYNRDLAISLLFYRVPGLVQLLDGARKAKGKD
jgi:hypothetical protein